MRPHEGPIPRSTAVQPLGEEVRRTIAAVIRPEPQNLDVDRDPPTLSSTGWEVALRLDLNLWQSLEYSAQGSPPDLVGRHARVAA